MAAPEKKQTDQMGQIGLSVTLASGLNRQIIAQTRGHQVCIDFRKERGGDDAAPTPPEYFAMALGGCVLNLARIIGLEKDMDVNGLGVTVSGAIDPSRAFGLETEARAGFAEVSVLVELGPNVSDQDCREFHRELAARCPLCDTVANPTPFQLKVSATGAARGARA